MKKELLNNKKGFTLVELLAVIVVLAIIILIAMPSVMSAMDKARRNALVTEVNEISKIAQTAYADKSMGGTGLTSACFNLKYLVDNGYMDKKLESYTGYVIVEVSDSGKVSTKADISNGIYRTGIKNADGTITAGAVAPSSVTNDNLAGGTTGSNVPADCAGHVDNSSSSRNFEA